MTAVLDLLSAFDPSDPRILAIAATAFAAGLVRGFTGFGAGMIFIPIGSALYGPVTAIVFLFIIDFLAPLPMLPPHLKAARWREVAPLALTACLFFPLGLVFLTRTDPLMVRWGLSLFVLAVTGMLASGLRFQGEPGIGQSLAVGSGVGFLSGAVGLGGPLMVLFWLGGPARAAHVRSNVFAFFAVFSLAQALAFWANGIFSAALLAGGLALTPLYLAGLWLGSKGFDRSSEDIYRKAALAFCGLVAVATLPVWR